MFQQLEHLLDSSVTPIKADMTADMTSSIDLIEQVQVRTYSNTFLVGSMTTLSIYGAYPYGFHYDYLNSCCAHNVQSVHEWCYKEVLKQDQNNIITKDQYYKVR